MKNNFKPEISLLKLYYIISLNLIFNLYIKLIITFDFFFIFLLKNTYEGH